MEPGEQLVVDVNDLTHGEIEAVEDITGLSLSAMIGRLLDSSPDAKPVGKVLSAFAWLMKRRDNPDYTLDEARALKLGSVKLNLGGDDPDEDPTPPSNGAGDP